MKKILVIDGHPNAESLNRGLADAYVRGARNAGFDVQLIRIAELDFNPNLQHGFQKRTELEPDLVSAWEKIKRADHLVWVHPVWWGDRAAFVADTQPVIPPGAWCWMLTSGSLGRMRRWSRDQILSSKTLIGRVFRQALEV